MVKISKELFLAISVCLLFFIAYLILGFIKHLHFETGYDLAISNQLVYEYSRFHLATPTVSNYSFVPGLWDHFELIYIFLSPFYWIFSNSETLILLQSLFIGLSGIPVFLLAQKHKLNNVVCYAILFSYFLFFGIQNALYSDVHSLTFAAAFLAFFIYFLDVQKKWQAVLFFFLAITCKEDIALLTFMISFVYLILRRKKFDFYLMLASIFYLFLMFAVWFPHFTLGYIYANPKGLFSDINLLNLFNTREKLQVIFDSFLSFGFLPILNPLLITPFLGDLAHYFIFGNETVLSAQTIFLHYRVTDSILLIWPVIKIVSKYKKLNNKYFGIYILFFAALVTYTLHTPLTYLSKSWFWTTTSGVSSINKILSFVPNNAYIATQVNIAPHISNRQNLVLIYGDKKDFKNNTPCGKKICDWFKWVGNPKLLVVDSGTDWNIINLLANRPDFINALSNMEKTGYIKLNKKIGSSEIYSIQKKPY